jgi:hypothetical protein
MDNWGKLVEEKRKPRFTGLNIVCDMDVSFEIAVSSKLF